jgi:hypothetical protein
MMKPRELKNFSLEPVISSHFIAKEVSRTTTVGKRRRRRRKASE